MGEGLGNSRQPKSLGAVILKQCLFLLDTAAAPNTGIMS